MRARLVFRDASGVDRAVELPESAGTVVEIGRGDGCLVQVADASMSRRHASLRLQDGRWVVADQNSTGGTWVNERRTSAAALNHGDWIRCGAVYLQFQTQHSAAEHAAAPGPSAATTLVGAQQAPSAYGLPPPVAPPPTAPPAPAAAHPTPSRPGSKNPALFRSRKQGYVFTEGYNPSLENFDRVLNFLPIFEDTSRPFYSVESAGGEFRYRFSTEVHRFIQVAVEQGLIVESNAVDWLRYKHPIYRNLLHIDGADLLTCQRLLTAFVDDSPEVVINLAQALHGGLFLRVLYRLRTLRDELFQNRQASVESGRIEVLYADLTTLGVDAAVVPTDERLSGAGGLDAAMRLRAGGELTTFCQRIGSLPTGEARLVPGFSAPQSYILLTVGPRWGGGDHGEDEKLVRCYEGCLRLCLEKEVHTVAFPAIATGAMGFPPTRAAQLAVAVARRVLGTTDKLWKIYFTCHDAEVYRAFVAAIDTPPEFLSSVKPAGAAAAQGPAPSGTSLSGAAASAQPSRDAPSQVRGSLPNPEGRAVSVFLTQTVCSERNRPRIDPQRHGVPADSDGGLVPEPADRLRGPVTRSLGNRESLQPARPLQGGSRRRLTRRADSGSWLEGWPPCRMAQRSA
ncbi:MAG: macro domain-containing protein [Polyangia bacterium]